MEKYFFLIKDDYYKEVVDTEEIVEKLTNNNETMKVNIKKESGERLYHFFCEESAKQTGKEASRIKFFNFNNFPDGVFISYKRDGTVDCHICELKRTPSNSLDRLTKQLFSGYIHCKTLLTILDIDPKMVNYKYHVFLIHDKSNELEYNKLPLTAKKMIPGTPRVKESDYDYWMQNKIYYEKNGYIFDININKHKLYKMDDSNEYYVEKIL